jgi:hypothetical protein
MRCLIFSPLQDVDLGSQSESHIVNEYEESTSYRASREETTSGKLQDSPLGARL